MSDTDSDVSTPEVNMNDAIPSIDHSPSSEDTIDVQMEDTPANISTTHWWKTFSWVPFGVDHAAGHQPIPTEKSDLEQ